MSCPRGRIRQRIIGKWKKRKKILVVDFFRNRPKMMLVIMLQMRNRS